MQDIQWSSFIINYVLQRGGGNQEPLLSNTYKYIQIKANFFWTLLK